MNRMLRMKIQDGGRQDERRGFKYVSNGEKIRLNFSLMLKKCLMYFGPVFPMHLNKRIGDCCFFLRS